MPSIPASQIVQSTPSVLSGGGTALDVIGLALSYNTRVPIGTVASFPSAAAVSAYFGPTSVETAFANTYFLGFTNSNKKPGALLFAQYPIAAVPGYTRSGAVSGMTLAQLQALSGYLVMIVGGAAVTSSAISLSAATSFSSAAAIIQAAFTSPGFTVAYDSISGAFVFTNTATGPTSTIIAGGGTLAAPLMLTTAAGAVSSPGAAIATPVAFMNGIIGVTTNWVAFATIFQPVIADMVNFGNWTTAQDNRYLYALWDNNATPTQTTDNSSAGALLIAEQASGIAPIYAPTNTYLAAAFLMGAIASIDFTETQGRSTLAFKGQSGVAPDVINGTISANLKANGYNFYGQYSTANENFNFLYPGSVTGQYDWIDSYINEVWMTNQFQLAIMVLFTQVKSIPYNTAGYALIEAALGDPIQAALNFGAIQPGVPLSQAQAAEVNGAAGVAIDGTLSTRGWYLQVLPASAQVRTARQSPPCTFWYTDGGSVQSLNIASVEVQ